MSEDTLSILLVEDNDGDARLVEKHLETDTRATFDAPELTRVESLDGAEPALAEGQFDLVLLDLGLPGSSGIETVERLRADIGDNEDISPTPVIVLTGLDDERRALEAIQAGAQDYLVKGEIDGNTLGRAVRYALERHEQERELKRQNERLERFAAVVSHDLRNPLNAAETAADVGLEEVEPGSRAHRSLEQVARATDRMGEIIEDMLTLARQGQSVDETENVHLGNLVRNCWSVVEHDGATLEVAADVTVEADPGRLQQLVENLFRNAVEHGSTGSRTGSDDAVEHGSTGNQNASSSGDAVAHGSTGSRTGSDDAVEHGSDGQTDADGDASPLTIRVEAIDGGFAVADDGVGIPEGERDQVFEAGYTTNERGTGFGLNIVKDIAEAHGWRVSLTESESGGARFEVTGVGVVEAEQVR